MAEPRDAPDNQCAQLAANRKTPQSRLLPNSSNNPHWKRYGQRAGTLARHFGQWE